ncbi:MAG: redoxin domain-containing protein [Candidatus Thermoplasmatota archaeon]
MTQCTECGAEVAQSHLTAHAARVHPTPRDRAAQVVERNWKTWTFVATVVLAVVVVGYLAAQGPSSAGGASLAEKWNGRTAPSFSLPDAVDGSTFAFPSASPGWTLLFLNEGLGCAPCAQQTQAMDTDHARFDALGVRQASIQVNSVSSLRQWAQGSGVSQVAVLSDPDLAVQRAYETTGREVSMMPGMTAGHTFILVDPDGIVRWRHDYGPGTMFVDPNEIFTAVSQAMGR